MTLAILNFPLLCHNTALLKTELTTNMIDFFIKDAWAAPAQQAPGFASFVPLIIICNFLLYFNTSTNKAGKTT